MIDLIDAPDPSAQGVAPAPSQRKLSDLLRAFDAARDEEAAARAALREASSALLRAESAAYAAFDVSNVRDAVHGDRLYHAVRSSDGTKTVALQVIEIIWAYDLVLPEADPGTPSPAGIEVRA